MVANVLLFILKIIVFFADFVEYLFKIFKEMIYRNNFFRSV
jgi:hypothetical protein